MASYEAGYLHFVAPIRKRIFELKRELRAIEAEKKRVDDAFIVLASNEILTLPERLRVEIENRESEEFVIID